MSKNVQNKKHTAFNIAYCGISSALAVIVMFVAIIPALAYLMPALAGMIVWSVSAVVRGKNSVKWGGLTYVAVSVLSLFLVPEIEGKTLFILLFGYYPLLREKIEFIKYTAVKLLIKAAVFNIAAVVFYYITITIFGIADMLDGLDDFGRYAVYVLWGMSNVAFALYDIALGYHFRLVRERFKPLIDKKIK
ncbi:MAG: hypothetical protein FWG45_07435 [Oscillospiraceae bacterium]|nr:hypothetical protein [Oscillospiraceae bacterium]